MNLAPPKSEKKYLVNEIFFSLQGEGVRAGTPNLFLRFSKCNLKCSVEKEGFDCDTEFESGEFWSAGELVDQLQSLDSKCKWIILTGGEPSLQLDESLIDHLKEAGYSLAIETNGTREISPKIDWITVSPKTSEHSLKQLTANEVKYVRRFGMGIPQTKIKAEHYLLSPAFEEEHLPNRNLEWCISLAKKNPPWRLSLQMHKLWNIS